VTRIKRGTNKRRRHKKLLKATKGHQGVRHTLYRRAHESLIHALAYSYAHRKEKKGDMRRLWNIPHKCGRPRQRHYLQPPHTRAEASRHRD
ncbi:50S ribosomal protein L20, partial [Geodia barretti]